MSQCERFWLEKKTSYKSWQMISLKIKVLLLRNRMITEVR